MIYNTSRTKKSQLMNPEKMYGLPELHPHPDLPPQGEGGGATKGKNIIPDKELLKEIDKWTPPRKLDDKTLEEVIAETKKHGPRPVPPPKGEGS